MPSKTLRTVFYHLKVTGLHGFFIILNPNHIFKAGSDLEIISSTLHLLKESSLQEHVHMTWSYCRGLCSWLRHQVLL